MRGDFAIFDRVVYEIEEHISEVNRVCDECGSFYFFDDAEVSVSPISKRSWLAPVAVAASVALFVGGGAGYTIAAQSANIQGVSGASFTAYGWYTSLASAIAKAGL